VTFCAYPGFDLAVVERNLNKFRSVVKWHPNGFSTGLALKYFKNVLPNDTNAESWATAMNVNLSLAKPIEHLLRASSIVPISGRMRSFCQVISRGKTTSCSVSQEGKNLL
jgi:hypothetical protein